MKWGRQLLIRQLRLPNLKTIEKFSMQDFKQPMGVATYKTADEMEPELLKALPPKEELQRVFEESGKKEEKE